MAEQQRAQWGGQGHCRNRFNRLWNTQIFILSKKEIPWLRVGPGSSQSRGNRLSI